jgi:peptide/nickel transport system substrate-binding protein
MVFFKTSVAPFNDSDMRKALVLGIDKGKVLNSVGYPLTAVDSPLLTSHIGYNSKLTQKTGDLKAAEKILTKDGWKLDKATGLRKKGKKILKFSLTAQDNDEYRAVTDNLKEQWRALGADVEVKLQSVEDLQSTVTKHNYEALLYSIAVGADPDVYAYWHSSQADSNSPERLNFSEYRSQTVDQALLGGRSRVDPKVRAAKYEPFLRTWLNDNPALALYQPRYLYVVREPFYGFDLQSVVTPIDRYSSVNEWQIRESVR